MTETTTRPESCWPLPDVQRARDWLSVELARKPVLMPSDLELLADLSAECQRRGGPGEANALDQLLFATRHLQTQRERQIAVVRRRTQPLRGR
jgi:hypothetical protein